MSELRQNLITRDWVIIATERAKRPDQFTQPRQALKPIPCYRPDCPFCPGNEGHTEVETFRLGDRQNWKVRSFLNKYPALAFTEDQYRTAQGIFRSMPGIGIHEVIVEHNRHDLTLPFLEISEISDILRAYQQRYLEIRQDSRIKSIIIFKNHGERAGTSLEHPHSQLAATPIVPSQIRLRIAESIRFLDDTGECVFCRTLKDELQDGRRIILESQHFVAFIPYAALSPFHTWIFPRRHFSSYEDISEAEIEDLAYTLKTVLAKLYYGLNNPDYNYTIRSIPTDEHYTDYFHWYIAIVPRLTHGAGFELGSGMYINTALPEESAAFLRSVEIPSPVSYLQIVNGKNRKPD